MARCGGEALMCGDGCPLPRRAGEIHYRVVGPSRRQFIAQSTLSAIAAVLTSAFVSACGDGEIGGAGPTAPPVLDQGFTIRIADFPALQQVGGIARVNSDASNPIAVSRLSANAFAALSMICPHAGYKPINIVSSGFRCPNHNALFAADGNWTGGQRTRDLQSYPTTYNAGAGTLTIG
jgi:Rieske Fe-S protein